MAIFMFLPKVEKRISLEVLDFMETRGIMEEDFEGKWMFLNRIPTVIPASACVVSNNKPIF